MITSVLAVLLLLVLGGSCVYCALVIVAARRYTAVTPPPLVKPAPVSVLKPLCGFDDELEENLESFFRQEYPEFELLFAVHEPGDSAVAVVEKLRARYPNVAARLIVTGKPPIPNRKVYSLQLMLDAARHDLIVTGDSDVRAAPGTLRTIAAEFQDDRLGLATCPYRAEPGRYFWSSLEAVGLNTEFLAGVLVAAMLDGVKFALGPTLAVRREALGRLGGFQSLKDYLAEDFVLGNRVAAMGYRTILSSAIVEHRIGAPGLLRSLRHQLRWARSTRRSRPAAYVGLIFTNPLPLALLVALLRPDWWPALALTGLFRAVAAWATSQHVLRDPLTRRRWWLVPVQDLISFGVWLSAFFGRTVLWRGRKYLLLADGRFRPQ